MKVDKQQENIEPQQFKITTEENTEGPDGSKKRAQLTADTEDIIAFFAGIVAVIVALGMVFWSFPVNKLTIGVLTFSGVGAAIAAIIGARKKKRK